MATDANGMEAAEFYVSVFPNSEITSVVSYPEAGRGPTGSPMVIEFSLDGQPYAAINGGPQFQFDEAISFNVDCADQTEVDYYWSALSAGGEEGPCGWLKDRFGLSWQIFPVAAADVLNDPDPARANRAVTAMFGMKKIDLAELRRAADATG